jgi:hypothetical protein
MRTLIHDAMNLEPDWSSDNILRYVGGARDRPFTESRASVMSSPHESRLSSHLARQQPTEVSLGECDPPFKNSIPTLSNSTLHVPYTTMAWNLNLCLDNFDKVLIPFHYFAEPRSKQSPTTLSPSFPLFNIPAELQLAVYESCVLSTLWQLMRTCSRTRGPATKLFWANPSELDWYHCPDNLLFEVGSHTHPILEHCQDFARRITKIEIDLLRFENIFEENYEARNNGAPDSITGKAQEFWGIVGKLFPAAKRVVLTGTASHRALPPGDCETDKRYYTMIEEAIGYAPPHLVLHVAFKGSYNNGEPRRCTLYDVPKEAEEGTWQVLAQDWTPRRILIPSRRYTASPLGNYLKLRRRELLQAFEEWGIIWLQLESYARCAPDGMLHCPRSQCEVTFTGKGQFLRHMRMAAHHAGVSQELSLCNNTPEFEREYLESRQHRVKLIAQESRTLRQRIYCSWGKDGTDQRRLFREQLMAQLREENFTRPVRMQIENVDRYSGALNPKCWYKYQMGEVFRVDTEHACNACEGDDVVQYILFPNLPLV